MPPEDYYLNYFNELIDTVMTRYSDILPGDDLAFVARFRGVTQEARRLLVRLILRKGPLFSTAALRYAEVPDTASAVRALTACDLVFRNPKVRAVELLGLLSADESRLLFSTGDPRCLKKELFRRFEQDDEERVPLEWGGDLDIIRPAFSKTLRRLHLLYFGNEHQRLTEFILEDIGMLRFEPVPLSFENRLFSSADEIEWVLKLNDLREEFYQMAQSRNFDHLIDLGERLLAIRPKDVLSARWAKTVNLTAYRLEQLGELDIAKRLFASNDLPPSRERRCRIAYRQGDYKAAHTILEFIAAEPFSAEESAFHRRFAPRVYRQLKMPPPKVSPFAVKERHITRPRAEMSVEMLACTHIDGAVYRENLLPMGIFGLLFWPAIFADVSGVWHHRFQSAPADLYEPTFRMRRKSLIDDLLSQSKEISRRRIEAIWHEKQGVQNPFVSWNALTLEEVLSCFDAFTEAQWRCVFEHLLADLRNHRSGFPDLFVRDENGGRFIEVKGPNDRLKDNQLRWLEVFGKLGIPAEVCRVTFSD